MKIQDNYPEGKMLWFNDFYCDGNNILLIRKFYYTNRKCQYCWLTVV